MVIPPVPGTGSPALYFIVVDEDKDGPLQVPTWACDLPTATAAALAHKGVLYRAELVTDCRTPAEVAR